MTIKHFDFVVENLGDHQEYFPGTGGNVSLKFEDGTMLIKASGKRIIHMNNEDGVVSLYYQSIKDHFHATSPSVESEKESEKIISSSVDKNVTGRPSIETGFHTLLSNAVIHSHSAYVNMIACSYKFDEAIETIFMGSGIPYMSISYAKPGYYLTHLFLDKVKKLSSRPKVIFMKNHGIVVTAPSLKDAVELHEKVNNLIKQYFGFNDAKYPRASLNKINEKCFVSSTKFLQDFTNRNTFIFRNINNYILFPDLTVFCEDMVITENVSTNSKISISSINGQITYNTSEKEAYCIEENLIAFAFLMEYMKEHNLRPVYISKEEADLIRNMEQEKYRKMLIEK